MGRIVTASLLVLAVPLAAAAQRGAGFSGPHFAAPAAHFAASPRATFAATPRASAPMRIATARAPRSAPRVAATAGRNGNVRSTGRSNRRSDSAFFNSDQVDFQDVPGLGFDFPHLAAISGNRRGHGSRFNSGFPFGGFLLGPSIIEEPPAAESPAVSPEDAPVEAATGDPVERPSRSRARASAREESLAPPAPQPDAEQYVFVRRDGSLVFAVAYSWDNGSLRYVTPEGFRRTIAPDALDLAATEQFNEQRGLTFRSPA